MNDKEKEILFKSIKDFTKFFEDINERCDIKINDKLEIRFIQDEIDFVEILVNDKKYKIDNFTFENIIKEIRAEKTIFDKHELINLKKVSEENIRNNIYQIDKNTYKVHKEYIDNMYLASDIASVHGNYLKKLVDLLRIFNRENVLLIDNKEIRSKRELIEYLKNIGFESVERDAKFKL